MIFFVFALSCLIQHAIAYQCCAPKQLEAFEDFALGMDGGHLSKGQAKIAYDAIYEKRAHTAVGVADGQPFNVTQIQDFKKGLQYFVENGKCTTTKLTTTFQPMCVPDKANKTMTSYFGASRDSLWFTMFTQKVNDSERVGELSWSVTNNLCIIVGGIMTGTYNGKTGFMLTYGFSGVTLGIKDKSVFDKPKTCSEQSQKVPTNAFPSIGHHHFHLNNKLFS